MYRQQRMRETDNYIETLGPGYVYTAIELLGFLGSYGYSILPPPSPNLFSTFLLLFLASHFSSSSSFFSPFLFIILLLLLLKFYFFLKRVVCVCVDKFYPPQLNMSPPEKKREERKTGKNLLVFLCWLSYLARFLVEIAIAVGVAAETPRARTKD